MDAAQIVAEYKIASALEDGLFDNLPARGPIECSLHSEAFIIWWFRAHYGTQSLVEPSEP